MQLDFITAEMGREEGMNRSLANAEKTFAGWPELAMSYLKGFLSMRGASPFLAEEVREYATSQGLCDPPSKRAWGGIMSRASANKLIRSVGFGLTKNPTSHRTPATLWCKA
jgi:hypothetical protein